MKPNQVHVVASAVSRDSQQIIHAVEPRFTRQFVRDVGNGNRRNRIHDDVALVHLVTTAHFYVGTRPDANAASDSPAPDSLAKAFGKHHSLAEGLPPRSRCARRLILAQRDDRIH